MYLAYPSYTSPFALARAVSRCSVIWLRTISRTCLVVSFYARSIRVIWLSKASASLVLVTFVLLSRGTGFSSFTVVYLKAARPGKGTGISPGRAPVIMASLALLAIIFGRGRRGVSPLSRLGEGQNRRFWVWCFARGGQKGSQPIRPES